MNNAQYQWISNQLELTATWKFFNTSVQNIYTEPIRLMEDYAVRQGYINSGRRVAVAIVFCTTTPNICGPSVWIEFVTLLAPTILRWCLDFCKACAPLP